MPFIAAIFLVLIVIVLHKSKVGSVIIITLIRIVAPVLGFGAVADSPVRWQPPLWGSPWGCSRVTGSLS